MLVGHSSSETGRQMGERNSISCSMPLAEKQRGWLQRARCVKVYLVLFRKVKKTTAKSEDEDSQQRIYAFALD